MVSTCTGLYQLCYNAY